MKRILPLVVLFCCLISQAQVQFENGYYVDNAGIKHNVLIQNPDSKNNPTFIRFKNNPDSEVRTAGISEIKEFQVSNNYFIRADVDIDRTKDDLRSLKYKPDPTFLRETLFLKILLDGKADLFIYTDASIKRYFYRIAQSNLEQLVYLSYRKEPNSVAVNKKYQQQLYRDLNCEEIKIDRYRSLEYKTSSLVSFFKDYNNCKNAEYQTFLSSGKGKINLRIKLGAGLSNLSVEKNMTNQAFEFKNNVEPRLGIELEYVLPINRNKWGVFAEATYRRSSYEEAFENSYSGIFTFDYNSLELYSGLKHYLYPMENSKFFIGGGILFDHILNSEARILETSRAMDPELQELDSKLGGAIGIGYETANKFSAEIRYTGRKIYGVNFMPTHFDLTVDAQYSSLSLIFGYKI